MSKNPSANKILSLVRPSRDGDQFHYHWAARRCLSLLAPQASLVGVSIEGASPSELSSESESLAGEELIDIAEYYGHEDVSRAQLVRYMQLKHSSRQASKAWTASGLEKTLTGFSERYTDLVQRFGSEDLANRFEFWFVTNRPISSDFKEAVDDIANSMAPRYPNEIRKLERFTGLQGDSLSSFCSLIRFEDCQDDYWEQRNILFQEISEYLPDADVDAPVQLKELVTRKALSDSKQNPIITKTDVLRALKTNEDRLHPAPSLIKSIDNAVPREQEADLIRAIIQAENQPVIVHALAGVGKSVFSTRIQMGLPPGSISVLYDCFGNGQYRSATGCRHRHKEALVQISNELAAKGLCHPLIPTVNADAPAYVRAFTYRLKQAIRLIRLANPHAVLCIVIDAADNAQMAAEEIGQQRSFARDLLRETLPDGVRLVLLCRSHRRNKLDPPTRTLQLELKPFSRNETAAYLRQSIPDASEHDVDEFHRLSSQNPRVQALALSSEQSLAEILRRLGPNPTSVESAIGSLLNHAIAKLRDSTGSIEREQIDKVCAGLAVLRPRIPIPVLSQISGVSEEAIRSFTLDIGRPLLLSGDSVQFFDEPVETWFREQFKPSPDEMAGFLRQLMPLATQSAYVASTLPQLMLEAGQMSELVDLALASAALPETSPLEKHDVELQRLQFALKASLRSKRYLDAAKLALKAGGVTAADDRQHQIIQDNTDLAALFIEAEFVQEIVSRRTFNSGWLGSHHVYEAGLLCGRKEFIGDARSRLRVAYEWLRNWRRLTPEERANEKVITVDIAELVMAELNIHGPDAAAHSIGRWKPREVSFRLGRIIARKLIDHDRITELNALAVSAENNLCLVLAIIMEFRAIQQTPHPDIVTRAFRLVQNPRVKLKDPYAWDWQRINLSAVTALVETALKLSICSRSEAAALLTRYLPSSPPRGLSSRLPFSCNHLLCAYCLRAALEGRTLQLTDLAHPELKTEFDKKSQHYFSQEAREFKEEIGALLPWYQLWAAVLLGDITKKSLPDQLSQARDLSVEAAQIQYRDEFHTSNEIVLVWFDILNHMDAMDAESVDGLTSWIRNLKRPLFTSTLTALARLGARNEATKEMALGFAAKAFARTKEERADADSKASGYIEVARSILTISASEAKAYFDEAVEVSSKIGQENLARWDAMLDLADRAARQGRSAPETAYQFARCAELTWDYVARDKHFDWESTVRALSSLCPSSSLAILSRWRDRGFGWPGSILPVAIHALMEHGRIDPRDALALIGFEAEWDYPKLLASVLDECADRSAKETAATLVFRYMKWEGQTSSVWKRLREITEQHGLSLPGLDPCITFAEHEERTVKDPQAEHSEERRTADKSPEREWDKVFSGSDFTTVDGISRSYAAFKSTPVPWNRGQFFIEIFQRVPAGGEAAFIAAVGNTPEFNLYDLRNILEQIPDPWKGRVSVVRSLEATLKAFCRRFCMKITKSRYDYDVLPLNMACTLAGVGEEDIVQIVLDTIGESPDLADSSRLFSLIGLLKSKLSHDEALEVLTFGLSLFDAVIEDEDGDGTWSVSLAPPTSIKASIAGFIYAGLAAPPARLRWEAAHAVLGLCALGRNEVLQDIVSLAETNSGGPFADARLPFYRLHAFQWLMIAFARAAIEFSATLAPFASRFVDWALNDQPHVMIRLFAARAALALIENGVLPDEDHLANRLTCVNVTSLPVVQSNSHRRVINKKNNVAKEDNEDRFYFGIYIGSHWYAPLGRIFAMSQGDIEAEALEVIRNELNCSAQRARDEDERVRRNLYYDYYQTHVSHDAYPDIDDLQFYLAYHAMMIVAGRLLATTPTHRDTEWDDQDEFTEWLSRHDLARNDGRWLADRRDPAPLDRPVWRVQKKGDIAYGTVTPTDFDQALRIGDIFNVWGSWSTANSTHKQSVAVRSALVSPDKSMALLRKLSTKDVYDYLIPSSDPDFRIDDAGFGLKGWIEDRSGDVGLDEKDHWSGGVRYPPPVPSPETIEIMVLETDSDKRIWRNDAETPVMFSQVWGYLEERNQDRNPERGRRLQASFDFVKDMLSRANHDLIIEVQIERNRHYRRHENRQDNDEQIPTATKLYLITADGHITTL